MDAPKNKTIPIKPVAGDGAGAGAQGEPKTVRLYEASRKIYARTISGYFARWRWALVFLTQLVFYGLPWLKWGDRQAVLFDLAARRFYLFGWVLYPQDLIYLSGLLVISALSLFLFTAIAGRLWCGYSCPQTVYTEIFMWVEQRIEGNRSARMRLDNTSMNAEKLVLKSFKHIVWIGIAMWTGFTFVGYFTPIRELGLAFLQTRMGSWEVFWVFFYAFATYGNAGFMREQVCKYMCPYARFQSAMFDQDTMIVAYDAQRGEKRGPRSKNVDLAAKGLGDCIDCKLCVQVCPTGIDIRDGLQYECIGCGLCADACDSVMDKMGYAPGLIRYDTQRAMDGVREVRRGVVDPSAPAVGRAKLRSHLLRPRVLIYAGLLTALTVGLMASLVTRAPLKVDAVRDRASLARVVDEGRIENVYRLQIMNATEQTQRYRIEARGLEGLQVVAGNEAEVGPAESRWVAVRLQIPPESAPAGSHEVHFDVSADNGTARVSELATFIVPR
ncbi:MAG: cytochrome c oxidase accessory protein CcoG [Burkholderiaceae bacterium]